MTKLTRRQAMQFATLAGTAGFAGQAPARQARIAKNRRQILDFVATYDPFDYPDPKHGFPICIARLEKNPADARSLEYVRKRVSGGAMFGKFALSRLYFQYRDVLPAEIREAVRRHAAEYSAWFGSGTENHINMWRTAAYLFAEEWPEDNWHGGLKGRDVKERCREYFRTYSKQLFSAGMGEWDSPVYMLFSVLPFMNVFDFARDSEVKRIAEALLDFYLADWAVDYFHGFYGGPHKREYYQDRFHRQPMSEESDYMSWLWWEEPFESIEQFRLIRPDPRRDYFTMFAVMAAVSPYAPKEVISNIAEKKVALPYMSYESKPTYQLTGEREDAKSVYVTEDYVLGAGYFNLVLEWGWANNQVKPWGLAFRSKKKLAELSGNHPYYLKEGNPENSFQGYSPYQRLFHHRNALLALYNVPREDKYQMSNLRIPQGLDRMEERSGWVFLQEGDAYAAIRPLPGKYEFVKEDDGFIRLKNPGTHTGFVLEAAQRKDFATLEEFISRILQNAGTLRHAGSTLAYRTMLGDSLELRYFPPRSKPICTVNGQRLDFDRWMLFDSPYVWAEVGQRVLNVCDGRDGFTIDYSGAQPEYKKLTTLSHSPRLPTAD